MTEAQEVLAKARADWSRWQCALDDALGWRSSVLLEDL